MERRIKMIGLDLDGTLLTEKKELLPYTRQVLDKAIKEGILVLMATGRPFMGIPEELRYYPGIRYALTSNGARVLEIEGEKVLIKHLLPLERAKKALETLSKYDTLQEVYFGGQAYAPEDKMKHIGRYHHNPYMWEYLLTTRKPVPDIREFVEKQDRDMDKIQGLFADMEERDAAWKELSQQEGLALVGSLGYNIEINASGVNKGTALVELGRMLGIDREEIMACGDGDNDADMLREVGFGVAMENAIDKVKEAADYITVTNDEQGAAKAIERFALRGGELC